MFIFRVLDPINLRVFFRVFTCFVNPLGFAFYLILPFAKKYIKVRTPIGHIKILMRNRQSARTLYSIFIREDYKTDNAKKNILDLGSNIGISALYFLSRNKKNQILCIEPDPNNAYYLQNNLERFKDRSNILYCAIGTEDSKYLAFNLSKDGKYSSFKKIGKKYDRKIDVDVISLNNALKKAKFINDYPILIKIDIEGLEKDVIKGFDFKKNDNVKELIIEAKGCKNYINRKSVAQLINGYVENYVFQ